MTCLTSATMKFRWFILGLAFLTSGQTYAEPSTEGVAECKSQYVWDQGYVLSFDLKSNDGDLSTIEARLFEYQAMWTLGQVFSGRLYIVNGPMNLADTAIIADPDVACDFQLVDSLENPSVQILFDFHDSAYSIDLAKLRGEAPPEFSALVCESSLLEDLARRGSACRSAAQ